MPFILPSFSSKTLLYLLWCAIGLVYISNLFVPILEIDAAQYAEMSREMLQSNNCLHLFDLGGDYLDKPPFLFWISAFSMKIFGVSVWAYKLPSLLFAVWSIFALYRFSLLFYSKEIATKAALLFASCQAMFLMTNDIKTDTILMSFAITAFWQIASWLYNKNKTGWIWAAVCIAGAMLTKGPIGFLVIGFGFLPHFIIKKQWKNLWRWQYIVMLLVIAVLLLPMSYGLYTQFDLQPHKIVNGETGVSGLRFYYWTQSFGRITGESDWNNNASFFYLYQNLLWGMIPFTLFFVMASIRAVIKLAKRPFQPEWISSSAVILSYLALGMSNFQLPHYIYVVLPFICLLTARYFISIKNYFGHKFRIFRVVHNAILFLLLFLTPAILLYIFPSRKLWQTIGIGFAFLVFLVLFFLENRNAISLFTTTVLISVLINLLLSFVFYPNILPYQKPSRVAQEIKNRNIPPSEVVVYLTDVGRSADFLLNHNLVHTANLSEALLYNYIITDKDGYKNLVVKNSNYQKIFRGQAFHIARLNWDFLNPNTRDAAVTPYFIITLNQN